MDDTTGDEQFPKGPSRRRTSGVERKLLGKKEEFQTHALSTAEEYSSMPEPESESEPPVARRNFNQDKIPEGTHEGASGSSCSNSSSSRVRKHRMEGHRAYKDGPVQYICDTLDRPLAWFARLDDLYGAKLIVLLTTSQHILKGVVHQFMHSSVMWLMRDYKVSGPQAQVYMSVASSAWALKPMIGMTSDLVPIWGYRKAPYVIISSLIGVLSTWSIGISTTSSMSILTVVACLFGMSLQASTCDLLAEAKYSEHLHMKPAYGPDLITYVWGGITLGNLVAIALSGWIIENMGPRAVFLVCLVPCATILLPTCLNFFEEAPVPREAIDRSLNLILRQKEVLFLGMLMTVLTTALTIVGAVSSSYTVQLVFAVSALFIMLPAFHILLRPEIAKVNTFFLLQASLSISISGASFYFYTNSDKQYSQGPHFSPRFFTTQVGMAASVMSLVGLVSYTMCMKEWSYRSLILLSNVLVTFLSLLDVILFRRWNLEVGIPDSVFVLGSSGASMIIRQWQWMPGTVVMSQLCPKGMEAIMFALLAGCMNMGQQIAEYVGAYLLVELGVHPTGAPSEDAQFQNLWKASCIATLLPAVTIMLIPCLVPQANQTDKLLLSDPSSAVVGSLFSLWKGGGGTEVQGERRRSFAGRSRTSILHV